jgi:hypothetical protein
MAAAEAAADAQKRYRVLLGGHIPWLPASPLARLTSSVLLRSHMQALRLAGAARAAGRTAAGAAGSQLFSLSDDGVMSLASLGPGDSLAVTAAEASQLQGMLSLLQRT